MCSPPLDDLCRGGEIIPDALLAHLSSVGWQHINLTGDYLWEAHTSLGPNSFRQLRRNSPMTAHAA
jgi:Tn3 transposase DDE domain